MEAALEAISKTFTRFFMPGLIFVAFVIIVPCALILEFTDFVPGDDVGGVGIILSSLIFGYLLDSAGAYQFTLHARSYNMERSTLLLKLQIALGKIKSVAFDPAKLPSDPDAYVTELWLKDEKLYDRVFLERAEWVLILESAFALLMSALVSICMTAWNLSMSVKVPAISFLLIITSAAISFLISAKGIQRMKAHNNKLVRAVESLKARPAGKNAKRSGK